MNRRLVACLLCIILFALPLGGCLQETEDLSPLGEEFFTLLTRGDFGAAHGLLSPNAPLEWGDDMPENWPSGVSLNAFVSFYDKTFSLIRMSDMRWKQLSVNVHSATSVSLVYEVQYSCYSLDTFSQTITIPLTRDALNWKIVWSPGMVFTDMDWDDKVLVSTLKQKRGEILDRDANPYAINAYADTVYVLRSQVGDLLDLSTRLASMTGKDAGAIRDIVRAKTPEEDDYAVIHVFPPLSLAQSEIAAFKAIPGVDIDRKQFRPMRYYPQKESLAHIIGYVHPVDADYDPMRYDVDGKRGYTGLEKAFEDQMAGYRGREIALLDAKGERRALIARRDSIDGDDLILSIDYDLQTRAQEMLNRLPDVGAESGAIVVIDPTTGDVLAAADFPTVDANIFSFPIPNDVYQGMLKPEAHQPLYDRVTQGTYAPGSTIKPLTAAMALQAGITTVNFEFTERIDWQHRQWTPSIAAWNYPPITRVSNYEGPVNMENGIIKSDNIYFAYLALKSGWGNFEPFLHNIGFGQPFPFDIPVATSKIRHGGSLDNLHLLASSGFGQGELLISPLQIAYTFSAFANGGDIMKPRLVCEFKHMNAMEYETLRTVPSSVLIPASNDTISRESVDILTPMLRKVVTQGSGTRGALDSIATLGKTGTTEIGGNKEKELAWSINFVADTDYERLVCVVLEVPTSIPEAGQFRHEIVRTMLSP